MIAALSDYTLQTVALGAAILGAVAGAVGAFALLRRQSLMGDAVAHAALPGICAGFLIAGGRQLETMLAGALVAGMAAAGAVVWIARTSRIKADAALGLVLSLFFAAGVVMLTAIQGAGGAAQAGLESFLFGQAAAMLRSDIAAMAGVGVFVTAAILLLWKEFKLVAFDPLYAAVLGLPVMALELGLTLLVALAVVIGVQMVGVVLMTAMLVAPAAAARQWVRRLGPMVALSALFGALAGVAGAVGSAGARGLATGPLIVLAVTALAAGSLLLAPERGLLAAAVRRQAARRRLAGRRVLASLQQLADDHGDPAWGAEAGMIAALHGPGARRTLQRLETEGLVRPSAAPPDGRAQWHLTEAGRQAAAEGGGR